MNSCMSRDHQIPNDWRRPLEFDENGMLTATRDDTKFSLQDAFSHVIALAHITQVLICVTVGRRLQLEIVGE